MLKIELLAKHHDKQAFDCGNDDLNRYLQTMANQHAKKGISKTYVLSDSDNQILGFYSLASFSFKSDSYKLPLGGYPTNGLQLPCMLIGRLAIATHSQGKGYANKLTAHALLLVKEISQKVGVCFVVVEPKTSDLIAFYSRFEFKSTLDNPLFMVLPVTKLS